MGAKKILSVCLVCFIAISFLSADLAYAQRLTGRLMGVVIDDQGIAIPGVIVEISSPALMGTRSEITNEDGEYRFINLPPGIYSVVFTLPGFQTIERENLRVAIDTTTTENITMSPTRLEESVTVTAESPLVDVTKSSLTTNYDKDIIEKLPTGRGTYFDIIKQNPGFSLTGEGGKSRFSAFGSNSEENAMYLDGVDLSNPEIGTAWIWSTADMFEEVEVKGVGAASEYGNFTGAVVNIVSKSGGNIFSGSAAYYGQFDALTGDNNPDKEQWDSYKRHRFFDVAATLGGPVIKDKLWFFGVLQLANNFESWWQTDPDFPSKNKKNEQFIKFSIQPTESHRFVLSYDHQYGYGSYAPSEWQMPETIGAETDPVHAWNAHYTFLISNSAFFELKYSGYWGGSDFLPTPEAVESGASVNNPVHIDLGTGIQSGGVIWPWEYIVTRNTANATLSYFAEDFLGGDHDFKVGVQYNRGTSEAWGSYSGGKLYLDYYGYNYLRYDYNVWRYGGTVNTIGGFLDDSWKVSDRLTINFGLRFDHHDGYIPPFTIMDGWVETSEKGPRIDNLIDWKSWSPRFGFALQLTSDQKTLLKGSAGRYYTYPYIANWEWPGPNVPDWIAYYWIGTDWELWYEIPGKQGYIVDPDLKNPYVDQISVGLQREVFPNFAVDLTYIYKDGKNNIGYRDIGGIYEEVQRVSPDNGKTYTVFNITNSGEEEHLLTNPDGWGQKYHGIILALNKKYSDRWMMQTSLTWSKATGLNLSSRSTGWYSQSQSLVWYTGKQGSDPNDLINSEGYLNLDRRWLFKFSFGYNFPWDILVSTNFSYQTGKPRITIVGIPDLNQNPYYPGTRIIAEEKGVDVTLSDGTTIPGRFEDHYLWDIRLQKTFRIYKSWRIHAFLDFFNVLNTDVFLDYWSYNAYEANFNIPGWMDYPRRIQVGLKLQF
ncbi:MAG: TonB-dependent receptor [Candidatus Aminicenantes bacterium]|nr:TonB-dependent receptor [Candidatus Aminicenantes bacterium]